MTPATKQLIVFVKAPIPGQCKTRLSTLLGEHKTAEFYQTLVRHCFEQLHDINDINLAIYATPDTHHPFIQQLGKDYDTTLRTQQGNNLGERMFNAMHESLKHASQVVLIGTDCPVMNSNYIQRAFDALRQCDIVFGPADDGGYVLIGANRVQPELFETISWGYENVLAHSLRNCQAFAYHAHLLETLWDIDTPEDFQRYQNHLNQNTTAE
ncbi:Glycosyltransferase [hydrothermal vent metagenome]|uniref:Glycosyltransferase n=1 Tax=hydrothermal vent metagenome TaxID=652676 RepID=A0A3B0XES4_9ZZZZ